MALNSRHSLLMLIILWVGNSLLSADEPKVIVVESMTTSLIRRAEIAARDTGMLKTIAVKTGEKVEAGTLLASLDDELQELAVREAELNVRIAELKANNNLPVETARAQVREAELEKSRLEIAARISQTLAGSDVSVRLAEKTREVAQFELNRAQKAKDAFSGSVSNAELNRLQVLFDQRTLEIEKAREDRTVASLKPEADQAAVLQQTETIARTQLLTSEREQEQHVARTSLEVAHNELALARLQLDRRRLIAPFSATIVAIERQPSEWVEPGTSVIRLIQLDQLRVEGFVGADEATQIIAGQKVVITFAGDQLPAIDGLVTFISPEIDAVNQQVRVWAEFENSNHRVRPGLVASMKVTLTSAEESSAAKTKTSDRVDARQ
jgi:multidrug efflux pump subunit AcrA (membrane-fusion protein)